MLKIIEAVAVGLIWAGCFLIPYGLTIPEELNLDLWQAYEQIAPAAVFIFFIGSLISLSLPTRDLLYPARGSSSLPTTSKPPEKGGTL